MPPETSLAAVAPSRWRAVSLQLLLAWTALFALTFAEWREMAHQWWDIDTYNHVLLVPAILVWLVGLRRDELAKIEPRGWWPGLLWLGGGLMLWLGGRAAGINLFAHTGALMAFQGALMGLTGARATLVLAFPLLYSGFLVPFGGELIPMLQQITARMTVALTHASGVPAIIDGLTIDTPGGKFVVAEECAGVKFLIAMVALATLVAWTGLVSWKHRIVLVAGAALISIFANGVRAWGTIYVAQWVGAERAGGFDHIVYGWVFFAVVIAAVLGLAWRFFDREPGEAGLNADEASAHPLARLERHAIPSDLAVVLVAAAAILFAALAALV